MDDEGGQCPKAGVNEVIGFLEILDDESGKIDAYKIGKNFGHQLDQLLDVIQTAQIFGFLNVSEGDLLLTDFGKQFVQSSLEQRKQIIADFIREFGVFQLLLDTLQEHPARAVSIEYLEKSLGESYSEGEMNRIRDVILDWGRYAELVWVDSDTQEIHLEEEEEAMPPDDFSL